MTLDLLLNALPLGLGKNQHLEVSAPSAKIPIFQQSRGGLICAETENVFVVSHTAGFS